MCNTVTEGEDKILCSRCGKVANPTDSWVHGWPNYGEIKLGYESCIDWKLFKKVSDMSPLDTNFRDQELVRSVINLNHPAVKNFDFQQIEIEWSAYVDYPRRLSGKYRLCRDCQAELLVLLGQFFFSNLPKEQPIRAVEETRLVRLRKQVKS